MTNLLPPKEKEEIVQEQNWRLVLSLGILLIVFLTCFALILFSVKIFIAGKVETQKIMYSQEKKNITPEMQELAETIKHFNDTFIKLDSFYKNQFDVIDVLERISGTLPSGIYFKSLSINFKTDKTDDGEEIKIVCVITGYAPTSSLLEIFKSNLEKEDIFQEIDFPPSNWLKLTNIDFQASFEIIK